MVLVVAALALIVLVGVVGIALWRGRAPLQAAGPIGLGIGVDHEFDPEHSARFRGGARLGNLNVTWPFVTLTIDATHLHLGGAWSRWLTRDEVKGFGTASGGFSSGVQFHTVSTDTDGLIFWTSDRQAVINALARFGW